MRILLIATIGNDPHSQKLQDCWLQCVLGCCCASASTDRGGRSRGSRRIPRDDVRCVATTSRGWRARGLPSSRLRPQPLGRYFSGCTTRRKGILADQSIVIGVRADPEPNISIFRLDSQGSVAQADADGPISSNFFELERGVARIALERRKIGVSQL